jgi:prepilin-type N-terminal cleavage/methylation domain-containing protein
VRDVASAAPRTRTTYITSNFKQLTRGDVTVNAPRARVTVRPSNQDGMTLIEVVVAISILAVLSTAVLGVYLAGTNTASAVQRRDVAVTVASQVLEKANAVVPSTIYSGRSAAAVEALRVANTGVEGVGQMYLTSDPTSPLPVPATLLLTDTADLGGTTYTVNTLVGRCFQPKVGGPCTAPTGWPNEPSTVPANMTVLSRVVVVVRWSTGATCKPVPCKYVATTLVDSNSDLKWNVP